MPRRVILALMLPALALIAWLVAAQLPHWTAPQPGWFAADTPGVCAAIMSMKNGQASRTAVGDIGANAVRAAAEVITDHYGIIPLEVGEPLAVEAIFPGEERRVYFVVTARLSDDALPKIAVIYLDAATGEARALITGVEDPALNCEFDLRGALAAALRSPPSLLLAVYVVVAGGLAAGVLVTRHIRGKHR